MKKGFGPRDDLIDKVRYGKLAPAQAEAEARLLGLEPLANLIPMSSTPWLRHGGACPWSWHGSSGDLRTEFANIGMLTAANAGIGISITGGWVSTGRCTTASSWKSAAQRLWCGLHCLKASTAPMIASPNRR